MIDQLIEGIAIVGIGGRFPGADSVENFWQNLVSGVKPEQYVIDTTCFDAAFFNYNLEEAAVLTPEARIFFEVVWEALEDAGNTQENATIDLFAVANFMSLNCEAQVSVSNNKEQLNLAAQIASRLRFQGAAVTLQGGSETALTAVHLACQNLLNQQADFAVVGGVSLESINEEGRIVNAAAGVVVLKRLSCALENQDRIYAVIRGTAAQTITENSGATLKLALLQANFPATTLGYLETHFSGEHERDLQQLTGLTEVLQSQTKAINFCCLDSTALNLGQTRVVAGMISLIKTILILQHQYLPPQCDDDKLNFTGQNTPFYSAAAGKAWIQENGLRRAMVSFQNVATEVTLLLEEAPVSTEIAVLSDQAELVLLATKTITANQKLRENLASYLAEHSEITLRDLAYTLQYGRREWGFRSVIVAKNLENLQTQLQEPEPSIVSVTTPLPLIWVFPEQSVGTELKQLAYLYHDFPLIKQLIDEAAPLLFKLLGRDLRALFGATLAEQEELLRQNEASELILFLVQYLTAQLWLSWGIKPVALLGYGAGEYVAACLAKVFDFTAALTLVVVRAGLMAKLATGKLLRLNFPIEQLKEQLPNNLELLAVHDAKTSLVSGTKKALTNGQNLLAKHGVKVTELKEVAVLRGQANHSLLSELLETLNQLDLNPPTLAYLSSLTGNWITETEAVNPDYYVKQFKQTVQFYQGIKLIQEEYPDSIWVEFGTGKLVPIIRETAKTAEIYSAFEGESARTTLLTILGRLWSLGYQLPWTRIMGRSGRKISLPTHPFERVAVASAQNSLVKQPQTVKYKLPEEDDPITAALWLPGWEKVPLLTNNSITATPEGTCVIFEDLLGLGERLVSILRREYRQVIRVRQANQLLQVQLGLWMIRSGNEADLTELFRELASQNRLPRTIYFLWLYDQANPNQSNEQRRVIQNGFETLLKLAKVLAEQNVGVDLKLQIICNNLMTLAGENCIFPEKGLITGLCRSLEHDLSGFESRIIDLPAPINKQSKLWQELLNELRYGSEKLVLLRQTGRWLPTYKRLTATKVDSNLKKAGVYLITGGLTGVGKELACYLAEHYQARIIILSRTAFPERETWTNYHLQADAKLSNLRWIATVKELEEQGAFFEFMTGNVASYVALEEVFELCQKKGWRLEGIFHAAGVERRKQLVNQDFSFAKQVLASKMNGAKNLAALALQYQVKFLMFYSDLNSLAGTRGEPDTAAANSFLNHYAAALQMETNLKVLAVCWDHWQEIGRAARRGITVKHPLLPGSCGTGLVDNLECQADGSCIFQKTFIIANDWVVSEHLYQEIGIVPGTAWIGMLYQAAAMIEANSNWMIKKLKFLVPCQVFDGTPQLVTLNIKPKEQDFSFRITSEQAGKELLHARGILQVTERMPEMIGEQTFKGLKAKLTVAQQDLLFEAVNASGRVQWGPRWQTMRRFMKQGNQYFAEMSLADDFHADLKEYSWHPSLLDTALALTALWDRTTVMLPAAYQEIQLIEHLPDLIYVWVKIDEAASVPQKKIVSDVTLFNRDGKVLGQINQFELQKVPKDNLVKPFLREAIPLSTGLTLTDLLTGLEQTANIAVSLRELPELILTPPDFEKEFGEEVELPLTDEILNFELQLDEFNGSIEHRILSESYSQLAQPEQEIGFEVSIPEVVTTTPEVVVPQVVVSDVVVPEVVTNTPSVVVTDVLSSTVEMVVTSEIAKEEIAAGASLEASIVLESTIDLLEMEQDTAEASEEQRDSELAEVAEIFDAKIETVSEARTLSQQQLRSYFLDRFTNGQQPEVLGVVVWLNGDLDMMAFQQAIQQLFKKYEILRTILIAEDLVPREELLPLEEIKIENHDLSFLEAAQQRKQIEILLNNYRRYRFNLNTEPLAKFGMIYLSPNEAICYNLLHQMIADRYSQKLLLTELATYYNQILNEGSLAETEAEVKYAKYRQKQLEQSAEEWFVQAEDYWRSKLMGIPALYLPTDHPRPLVKNYQSENLEFIIPPEFLEVLHQAAREYQLEHVTLLLAVTAILFYRYSGQEAFVIGVIQTKRSAESAKVIGPIGDTLPLVCQLKSSDNFLTILRRIRNNLHEAQLYQELPLEKIIEAVQPEANLSQTPIFQVCLGLQELQPLLNNLQRITTRSEVFHSYACPYDLRFNFFESQQELIGTIDYSTDIFEEITIKRIAAHLMMLLEAVLKTPELPIIQLEMLTPIEKQTLLKNWNSETMILPIEKTVMERFEKIVGSYSTRIAMVDRRQQYTYTKLNELANNVARYLTNQELGFGHKIALSFESASKMVIAILGVLKIGATYLPFDSNWSAAQMKMVLADSEANLLIADYDLPAEVEARHYEKVQLVGRVLEDERVTLKKPPADSLAYITYTFDANNNLRGVGVSHANLIAAIWARYKFYQEPMESLMNLYGLNQHGSVASIYSALLSGNKLVLVDQAELSNVQLIMEMMQAHQVTHLASRVKYYHRLLQNPRLAIARSLKVVSLSGEAGMIQIAKEHYQVLPDVTLVNEYGYNETTTNVTAYCYTGKERDVLPIGSPLANTQIYLLDSFLQPVPVGVVGEIYVGGEQIPEGYYNNDGLNQKWFLQDLFNGGRKARLFRTGDLARWLPEGQLDLLGCGTDQIKIRGFWVDLQKIKATLLELPEIAACVVLSESERGNESLLALLQPVTGVELDLQQLQLELALRLPAHLIPERLISLKELPLNEMGQIESSILHELLQTATQNKLIPPTTEPEKILLAIWQELLNRQEIGIDQNFFELGGNSWLGMQLIQKSVQAGLSLTIKEIFTHPTIRQLGQLSQVESTSEKLLCFEGQPLTVLQRWFLEELALQKQPTRWNANLLLHLNIPISYPKLVEAFLAVYHHHGSLRARFQNTETGWLQMIESPGKVAPISYLDLRPYPNEQQEILETICDRRQNNFILEQGNLIQVILFQLGESDYRLWINAHRLLVDSISLMIVVDDLMLAYQQLSSGAELALPKTVTSTGEWIRELEKEVQAKILPNEKEYWLSLPWDQIAGFPMDLPETASQNTVASVCDYVTSFTPEATKSLRYFAETSGVEVANVLLGAFLQAITDWTGREYQDITVLNNGRDLLTQRGKLDVRRTVGWLSLERLLFLKRSSATTSIEIIRELNQQIMKIPTEGHGYNLLRYLGGNEMLSAALAKLRKRPGILFNYQPVANNAIIKKWGIGQATEQVGCDENSDNLRFNLIELHVFLEHEQLYLFWRYSKNVHRDETIVKLNAGLCNILAGLVSY